MFFLRTLLVNARHLRRVVPLMRHPDVPFALKATTGAMGLLIISPLDIFGDIPLLGLLDDAALLSLLALGFVALAGKFGTIKRLSSRSTDLACAPQRPTSR